MANQDRISEAYRGELWDETGTARARRRIDWLVGHAHGRTLDLGCSQGIASLLAARAGADVTGVDIEFDRLVYAERDRAEEEPATRDRAHFVAGSGTRLPFPAATFDAVILGEVVEHVPDPGAVLAEVARVLRPDGSVALTTPFGLSIHHDHDLTFYPDRLLRIVGAHLTPTSCEVVDRYLRVVATPGAAPEETITRLIAMTAPAVEAEFEEVERAEYRHRLDVERLRRQGRDLTAAIRERDRLEQVRAWQERRVAALEDRVQVVTAQRDRLDWRLRSTFARRWWRLGRALNDGRRSVRAFLLLPLTMYRVLFGPAPTVPKPDAATRATGGTSHTPAPADGRSDLQLRQRYLAPPSRIHLQELRVAAIADTFTETCFAPECTWLPFRPDDWRAVLERDRPHVLFVESAWKGNGGAWEFQVGTYNYAGSTGLPHLSELVAWCRDHDVPTVFWNKEDPVHFDKFKEAAQLFDVVLTTDEDRVPAYEALPALRAQRVAALPFAAQPRLHHPVDAMGERDPRPVFAGTYYRNRHPARKEQLEMLLDAARPFDLVIFDRTHGQESDSVGFPERFQPHIRGGLPYAEIIEVYRRHRLFLNTNSVTESPTMFSRRVFELLACGTPVVSTPSVGMSRLFGDVIRVVDEPGTAAEAIRTLIQDDRAWQATSRAGLRRVLGQHTYAHRLATVARLVGYDLEPFPDEAVTVLLVDDDERTGDALVDLSGITGTPPVVVATDRPDAFGPSRVGVTTVPLDGHDLRTAFRHLAEAATTPWVLVVDPRVPLEAHTIEDVLAARRYTDADVIGWAEPDDVAGSHRFVDAIAAAPALVRRATVQQLGWDTDPGGTARLVHELRRSGRTAFAVDRAPAWTTIV